MLSAVVGKHIDISTFRHTDDVSVIDSSPLKEIVPRWKEATKADPRYNDQYALETWLGKVNKCLATPTQHGQDTRDFENEEGKLGVECDLFMKYFDPTSLPQKLESVRTEDRDSLTRRTDRRLLKAVFIGITVLVETLYEAIEEICLYKKEHKSTDVTASLLESYTCRHFGPHDRARPLLSIMRKNGWCKRDLFCLDGGRRNNLGISNLWFYAHMEPPRAHRRHKECSEEGCRYDSNVDMDNYEVMHTKEGCTCEFVGPSPEILEDIITSGHFPVINVDANGDISAERSDRVRELVAISHVWADGHGNPKENSLPRCFLRDLYDIVNHALGAGQSPYDMRSYKALPSMLKRQMFHGRLPTRLWIDTLCIPRYPLELRQQAIKGMRAPFSEAEIVLILDNSLLHHSIIDMSSEEMLARLKLSNWAKRLWTYHEDVVSKFKLVQFHDRSVDISRYSIAPRGAIKKASDSIIKYQKSRQGDGDMAFTELASALHSAARSFIQSPKVSLMGGINSASRYGINPQGRETDWLAPFRYVLETKSTSRESDQALCLASMMGLDMQKVAEAKSEEKMQVLWSLITSLPIGILFSKAKRKLTFEGFRWAPVSFLEVNAEWMGPPDLHSRSISRSVTDKGLRISAPAIFLEPHESGQKSNGLDENTVKSLIESMTGADDEARFFDTSGVGWNVSFGKHWHTEHKYLATSDGLAFVIGTRTPIEAGTYYPGVLISYKREKEAMRARAHRHVKVERTAEPLPRLAECFRACAQDMRSRYSPESLPALLWRASALTFKTPGDEKTFEEAKEYVLEFLRKQDGFNDADSKYWQKYYGSSKDYTGEQSKTTQQIDTVVVMCLFWPNTQARLDTGTFIVD